MKYLITYFRDFLEKGRDLIGYDELEWVVFVFEDKAQAIKKAKELNALPTLNLTYERFRVWEGKNVKYQKSNSRLVFDGANEFF